MLAAAVPPAEQLGPLAAPAAGAGQHIAWASDAVVCKEYTPPYKSFTAYSGASPLDTTLNQSLSARGDADVGYGSFLTDLGIGSLNDVVKLATLPL